jgi:hypothetical protein
LDGVIWNFLIKLLATGIATAANIAMMAIVKVSSISVKPDWVCLQLLMLEISLPILRIIFEISPPILSNWTVKRGSPRFGVKVVTRAHKEKLLNFPSCSHWLENILALALSAPSDRKT